MSNFYLTTAIDYVNSPPHLGTAYEKVTADVIARFKRLTGHTTRFLIGNDEHSQNVYLRSEELGLEPLVYCNQMEDQFREVWKKLNISFDDFIRTTEQRHHIAVQTLVNAIYDAGDIYEAEYVGWYCVSCEAFKHEKDLKDGLCPLHQSKPDWIKERNHFFRLSKYQEPLLERYRNNPSLLEPEPRRNEIINLIEAGLDDISISRQTQKWGIPIPFDSNSVVYVWIDALVNYISGVGFGQDKTTSWKWWPANLHIIGKDITRFHSVIWPAMLISAGIPIAKQVFGHGFINFKGEKMSKTLGTVIDPLDAADKFGPDPLRLYFIREIIFGQDGEFSWERFENRYNADLANNLGNLVSRITSMAAKYCNNQIKPSSTAQGRIPSIVSQAVEEYRNAMENLALSNGALAAFHIIDTVNEYITEMEPWVLARNEHQTDTLTSVLYTSVEATRIATILLSPMMPDSCETILKRLGSRREAKKYRLDEDACWGFGPKNIQTVKGDALWPRLEKRS